jgi:hypothetical protein
LYQYDRYIQKMLASVRMTGASVLMADGNSLCIKDRVTAEALQAK